MSISAKSTIESTKVMEQTELLTIREASKWASDFLKKNVSESNISYLIQYGKVKKHNGGTTVFVDKTDLKNYYDSYHGKREMDWKEKLGSDLNWSLSFAHLREKDTTKHVHRLHPYKGKFIPQLVEYFLDQHTDSFKSKVYFKPGDVILDPFCGSGTTLVQANELGMHSIGVDVSMFNCMIASSKLQTYDFATLAAEVTRIRDAVSTHEANNNLLLFEKELLEEMREYNNEYFPSPDFKYRVQRGQVDESEYAEKHEKAFLRIYLDLVSKWGISLEQSKASGFLDKWYIDNVREEIEYAFNLVKSISEPRNKKILAVVLSRTIRSCRATGHSDLATLQEPQFTSYYCWKHKKICKPLFSIKSWFDRYSVDTLVRLKTFSKLKQNTCFEVLAGDSRSIDIMTELEKRNSGLRQLLNKRKINGIFTSPPYVGQIDYHEQHAYAYDLFGFERKDEMEIGPLSLGQGAEARAKYVDGISKTLLNCRRFLIDDFDVFLVANDKFNLYPTIAAKGNMKIVDQYKRPVLNRTERDRNPYSETIFHLKPA